MDFQGSSIYIGRRDDPSTTSWPAWSRTVDEHGSARDEQLPPVHSYAQAERLALSFGAERLFVPEDVLADMVRSGAGPS
jgi:hypothetical protein